MIFINHEFDNVLNKPLNDSYKRTFNKIINELPTSLNKPSLVVFRIGSFILRA